MLTLIDEYTRQCLAICPARKLTSEDGLEVVKEAVREHGAPDHLRSDNGSEFIARIVQDWFREHGIQNHLYRAGQPVAERLDRELPCPLARRVSQPGTAAQPARGPRRHRRLPARLQ